MTTAAPNKRGPYASSAKRRDVVSRAVLGLVDELGHDGVTTALVSQRSGVGEATILYHFPSKDHLLVAALARADDESAENSHAYAPEAVLDARMLAETSGATLETPRHRLFIMLKGQAATPGHPAAAYFAERTVRQVKLFADLITRSQQAGRMIPGLDPVATARQVIAVWDGLAQMRVSDPTFDVEPLLEDAVRRLTGQNLMAIHAMLGHSLAEPPSELRTTSSRAPASHETLSLP
ncbi:TetR/AcrR family transcriptional regulator [Paenarthrobacter sp. NPDC089989]|uniref:TetR/AcrR family transcriptional regulator n=1 Tax=unclassified Paenarthrobacter TaxID=2634190 RepID=UPI00381BB513